MKLEDLNPHHYPTNEEVDKNLETLLSKMNLIESSYGVLLIVSSGLRTLQDQLRINPRSPHSKHLIGAAVDISDSSRKLKKWIQSHPAVLSEADLYCENFKCTPTWVHFQCIAPPSGNRFFLP